MQALSLLPEQLRKQLLISFKGLPPRMRQPPLPVSAFS